MAKENGGAVAEPSWEELLGSNKWEGILDPLDLSLRRFIIRCGDFCQCSSDAFDSDDKSEYYGSSRYGKKSFFNKVKFEFATAYQVSALLYTTSALNFIITWDKTTNFQGYIATSTDAVSQLLGRREIYVIWRGTVTSTEWAENADFRLVAAAPLLPLATPARTPPQKSWKASSTSTPAQTLIPHSRSSARGTSSTPRSTSSSRSTRGRS